MPIIIDELIRSKRRTLSIEITSLGKLVVRAPMRYDIEKIQQFILRKNKWIVTKQLAIKNKIALRDEMFEKRAKSGSRGILFLGNNIEINNQENINKAKIILWYKREALKHATLRLDHFTKILGTKYCKIKITSAKKRWGSCSKRGFVNFSWRLFMAPAEIVDYVIAHEACHLLHQNHSKNFWHCVENLIPDYKNKHFWLKNNGFMLDL